MLLVLFFFLDNPWFISHLSWQLRDTLTVGITNSSWNFFLHVLGNRTRGISSTTVLKIYSGYWCIGTNHLPKIEKRVRLAAYDLDLRIDPRYLGVDKVRLIDDDRPAIQLYNNPYQSTIGKDMQITLCTFLQVTAVLFSSSHTNFTSLFNSWHDSDVTTDPRAVHKRPGDTAQWIQTHHDTDWGCFWISSDLDEANTSLHTSYHFTVLILNWTEQTSWRVELWIP